MSIASHASVDEAPKRLLVVDDDASIRTMLDRVLTGEGYAVQTVADGDAALARARIVRPDLVLLDLALPPTDGWDILARLRGEHRIPVIIVTARCGEAGTAALAGAEALLEKPLDYPTLLRTIADVLSASVAERVTHGTGSIQPL